MPHPCPLRELQLAAETPQMCYQYRPKSCWFKYLMHLVNLKYNASSISVTNVKTVTCMSILAGCCRQWCRPVHYGGNLYDLRNAGNWISLLDCHRAQHSGMMVTTFALNFFLLSCTFFPLWRCGPTRAMASSLMRFLDYTQRRITVGRTPLDEWSARRRDLYLTTHNTQNRQTDKHPCHRWDSNPRSQQASGRGTTP